MTGTIWISAAGRTDATPDVSGKRLSSYLT
jgi:hypothetical protein